MSQLRRLAIVGSGPSALYLLKHLADAVDRFSKTIDSINIFEQDEHIGRGMPYTPSTTDIHNLCNITSEELLPLDISFAEWLRQLDAQTLRSYGITSGDFSHQETYCRLAMGHYFADQFQSQLSKLRLAGIEITERPSTQVTDVIDDPKRHLVKIVANNDQLEFDTVVIASGHRFDDHDQPESGYFASPWPIQKILPADHERYNFTIGTLGASLSAFDVLSSLAHRHGRFEGGETMKFVAADGCDNFRIAMHSLNGWLPHLQYEQREPIRELYRHVDAETLQSFRDEDGFLRLDVYFDRVCRPALRAAFANDNRPDMVELLDLDRFDIQAFAKQMTDQHQYDDAFDGMRSELPAAEESIEEDKPIHWKEIFDDLMFALNYHAHWMAAEDHIRFQSIVMPFLLNVIAALPLQSAKMLLALRDAGRLDLIDGKASVQSFEEDETIVQVENDHGTTNHRYRRFVDCTGQGSLKVDQFPFASLVDQGTVRSARAIFADPSSIDRLCEIDPKRLTQEDPPTYKIGGIDIDPTFRVIGNDGRPNDRIYDIAFPHATGLRPYSYGLQACELTPRIVVDHWKKSTATEASSPVSLM